MEAIRIRKRIESEDLRLPELRALIGKDVEIIVLDESVSERRDVPNADSYPLRGSVLMYDDPFAPVAESDWETLH